MVLRFFCAHFALAFLSSANGPGSKSQCEEAVQTTVSITVCSLSWSVRETFSFDVFDFESTSALSWSQTVAR